MGDFNFNWLISDSSTDKLKNIVCDRGLQQTITEITRPTVRGGSLIDLVLTNQVSIKSRVLQVPRISDHYLIALTIPILNINKIENRFIVTRGKNIDYNKIKDQLCSVDWNFQILDVNYKCMMLIGRITEVVNDVAPLKQVKIQSRFKPWWNHRVEGAVRMRDESYKEYKRMKTNNSHSLYKEKRNAVVKIIKQEKKLFFEQKIDECKNDLVGMWATLNQIFPKDKKQKINEIHFDNKIITDRLVMPDQLNLYYVDSIKK